MTEVACALIKKGDEFLITQRSEKMSHPLEWEFPGGKLHPGESPERGLIREIMEELKVSVKVEQLLPSVTHDYGTHRIKLIPFICSIVSGDIDPTEHKEVKWIKKNELKSYSMLAADLQIVYRLNGRWR